MTAGHSTAAVATGREPVLPSKGLASVALPSGDGVVQEFAIGGHGPAEGWLEVTASGVCGTDVALFGRGVPEPTVLGHHVVGRIAALGPEAVEARGLVPGDRVVLEEYLPCGRCPRCATGPYRLCPETDVWRGGRRIGMIPVAEAPSLHGGNAEYTFLPANAVTHRLPDDLDDELAAWVLPYANGIDWVTDAGALKPGGTVVVLGPGYHGLAVAAAARRSGAGRVLVTGLRRDVERLAIAEAMGATPVVVGPDERSDVLTSALGVPRGASAGLVVDTVGADADVLPMATSLLGQGGRLVLTSPKRPALAPIDTAALIRDGLHVVGVRGRSPEAIDAAITSLADGGSGLETVPSVGVGLHETADMLRRLATGVGPDSPHVVVRPHS